MKHKASLLLFLALITSTVAYAEGVNYVQVAVTDDGATSELLDMPIGASPNLSNAKISMKYFGPQSESDISVVLTLQGAKSRYTTGETFGARFYAGDIPLSKNKYRMIDRTSKLDDKDIINLHLTLEDIA